MGEMTPWIFFSFSFFFPFKENLQAFGDWGIPSRSAFRGCHKRSTFSSVISMQRQRCCNWKLLSFYWLICKEAGPRHRLVGRKGAGYRDCGGSGRLEPFSQIVEVDTLPLPACRKRERRRKQNPHLGMNLRLQQSAARMEWQQFTWSLTPVTEKPWCSSLSLRHCLLPFAPDSKKTARSTGSS